MIRKLKVLAITNVLLMTFLHADFYLSEDRMVEKEFSEFHCEHGKSLKRGGGYTCYLLDLEGEKIFLPNNAAFSENFKRGDKFILVKTGALGFNKRLEFNYLGAVQSEDLSLFQSNLIKYIFIFSGVVSIVAFLCMTNVVVANCFVCFGVIDLFVYIMYFFIY